MGPPVGLHDKKNRENATTIVTSWSWRENLWAQSDWQ